MTLENPKNSFFWMTKWFLHLMKEISIYHADFQVCMLGGLRDQWTRIAASFPGIDQLCIECDHSHPHAPWRKALNTDGQQVWATLESQYPRKLCVALVMCVLQQLTQQGLQLRPQEMAEITSHPLMFAKQNQIAVGQQPRPAKLPPLVPEFSRIVVGRVASPADVPCSLLSKLPKPFSLYVDVNVMQDIPAYARLLRCSKLPAEKMGVKGGRAVDACEDEVALQLAKKRKHDDGDKGVFFNLSHEVAFGLPWSVEAFIEKACVAGHPRHFCNQVPVELKEAIDKHVEWNDAQLGKYRVDWCKEWLKRATELEKLEAEDRLKRPPHVQAATRDKRVLLTEEILASLGYEDPEALKLLREGATLAGDIEATKVFKSQFQPGTTTLKQLVESAAKRNALIMSVTKSSGDVTLDEQIVLETEEEVSKGWAVGPIPFSDLPEGCLISRRFALPQGGKTRMIDDFSISGINDSATSHNKIDLHMLDTFCAVVKKYFEQCQGKQLDSALLGKTYDLVSAYRQVPVSASHLKFSYFSIWNHRLGHAQIFQLLTLPFGAVHSVYNFLRLARMLYFVATKGLFLLTTSFYDDFILASKPSLVESSKNAMELVFMLTGWQFAREGKKRTDFDVVCRALGVEFNFSESGRGLVQVCNTQKRIEELRALIKRGRRSRRSIDMRPWCFVESWALQIVSYMAGWEQ